MWHLRVYVFQIILLGVSLFDSGMGPLILFLLFQDCLVPKVKRETLVLALQEKLVSPAPQVGKASL